MTAGKDHVCFESKQGICYVSESGTEYTYNQILSICQNNVTIARNCFDIADWQHIETLFEEGIIEGEWDENGNILTHTITPDISDKNPLNNKWQVTSNDPVMITCKGNCIVEVLPFGMKVTPQDKILAKRIVKLWNSQFK